MEAIIETEDERKSSASITSHEGEVAFNAIRKNFPRLSLAVTRGMNVPSFYAEGLIDSTLVDLMSSQSQTNIGIMVVRQLQDAVKLKKNAFSTIVDILSKEDVSKDVALVLKGTYEKLLEEENVSKSSKTVDSAVPSTCVELCKEFFELKEFLECCNKQLKKETSDQENLYSCIQDCITSAIEAALKSGDNAESIHQKMRFLCFNTLDVPTELREWSLQQITKVCHERAIEYRQIPQSLPKPEEVPLLTKDTLYHASLCCQAVSTRTAADFKRFLNSRGHKFNEVSMSISQDKENVDSYMIAMQDNIIYMAFQSEQSISKWIDGTYESFEKGLQKQMNRIPLRFIIELIVKQYRIIFTGFSFGGMLACCNAARLWTETCINIHDLKKNVLCITFGQPLVAIPYVQEAVKKYAEFENTIHSVYDQEDIFPKLLHYYSTGCKYCHTMKGTTKALTACGNGSSPVVQPRNLSEVVYQPQNKFEDPFPKEFLYLLASLQEQSHSYSDTVSKKLLPFSTALTKFKSVLSDIAPYVEMESIIMYGECCLITVDQTKGLQWNKLYKSKAELQLDTISIDKNVIKKHDMEQYQHKISRAYLEREPGKYLIPSRSKDVTDVSILKPEIKAVHIYIYPDEHSVVLEGNNLWFCHEVQLGEGNNVISIKNEAQTITCRSIQFNYRPTEKSDRLVSGQRMKVQLHSHFANTIRKQIRVEQEEPYSFSLRQIQLAKYTPSEVIKLGFMSAILEQYSNDDAPSERFNAITSFLEEAVKIVPLESIFFAIENSELGTAVECAKALVHSKISIPSSQVAMVGMLKAIVRMRTGQFFSQILESLSLNFFPAFIHAPSYSSVLQTGTARQEVTLSNPSVICASIPVIINEVHFQKQTQPISTFPEIADDLQKLLLSKQEHSHDKVLCDLNIEHIYPVHSTRRHSMYDSTLKSPIEVLRNARSEIASLLEDKNEDLDSSKKGTQNHNERMLSLVKEINHCNLKICTALIGAFMEDQICIPLLKSEVDTANVLSEKPSPVAMGAWALFSLRFDELHQMLARMQGNPLLLEIADYISGIVHKDLKKTSNHSTKYAGKLQFLLQGMRSKTVSCSSQYISYSLEHQLCTNLKFDKKIMVKELVKRWDKIFRRDALSLVAKSHRSLVARWLKWAVLIHDLRESLAKYTCVGVTGLINSGKSCLVSKLFGLQIKVGTTDSKRTTVPFLYNMDGKVAGLDVIDFPGVDDKDHTIPELANLLLSLAQIVIFVVDYRRISTDSAKEWLKFLKKEEVPVIVCLTHADRFYAECIEESEDKNPKPLNDKKRKIGMELLSKEEDIGHHPSLYINFYCLHLPVDSVLFNEDDLKEAGIGSPIDVGDKLVEIFEKKMKQPDLALNLKSFIHREKK